jgi:peptidylprolyl isomerase
MRARRRTLRSPGRGARRTAGAVLLTAVATASLGAAPEPPPTRSIAAILAEAPQADWREPDPANVLYMELDRGRVIIELAPRLAPRHVANIRALVREGYFDGLAFYRAQDNYVVQWGDAEERRRPRAAATSLPPEFTVPAGDDLPFTRLPDSDGYAPVVGFSEGFAVGRDPASGEAWLAHCYGAVGVARGNDPESGSGTDLYAVIGHAPRHLDRNITVVGRVLQGMELLSTLPRGPAPMGFYGSAAEFTPILRMRVAADLPAAERTPLEALRTDTATFAAIVEARRNRRDDWNRVPAGHIDPCNVPLPVRRR